VSLIDDALKRAQAADDAANQRTDRPWIPTPMPDAGLARRRRLLRWLAISLGVAGVAAAAVVALRFALSAGTAPRASPPAAPAPTARAVDIEWTPVAVATPVTPAAALSSASAVATATPAPRLRPTRLPAEGESLAETAPPPPSAPRPPGPIVSGRTYAGSVTLPGNARIELGGIVWSEAEPRALLNDRILGTGGYVEGFTVAKIDEDRVTLEKDGVTIYLSVK
jgi:hypothetical protein